MVKIGLITILYNSNDVLPGFFKSLGGQSYTNYHLYIIDNTPSVITDKILSELFQKYNISSFTHIKSNTNIGFAKANNIAIEKSISENCDYLLILNNDIEFNQTDLLKLMVACAESKNEQLIVPKILFYDTKKIWMAGGHFRWWKAMAVHVGENYLDSGVFDKEGYFDFAPLCFMLIKSSVFKSVGILDENYFVYFEDTDFLYRAFQKGFKVFYMPSAVVLHKVSSSTGGADSLFSVYYGNRNRIYFIRKHFGPIKKIISFSFVLATRLIKYLKYDVGQRKELIKGLKNGFIIKLNQ